MAKSIFDIPQKTFEHHVPTEEQRVRIGEVREAFARVRAVLDLNLRLGRCSSHYAAHSGTALEEACMWAIKSIVFERYNEACEETDGA